MESEKPAGVPEPEVLAPTVAIPAVVAPARGEAQVTIEHEPLPPPVRVETLPPAAAVPAPRGDVFGNPLVYALRRGLGLAIDLVLVTVAVLAIAYGQVSINPLTGLPAGNESAFDLTLAVSAGIAVAYVVVAQAIFGTTLGKLFVGLHVYARQGRFVGFGRALLRTLLLPLDMCVIGFILALLPGHRRLGDLFAGTVVARSPLGAFSPLLGVCGIAVVAAAPFLLAGGPEHVFAALGAFIAFGPPIFAHALAAVLILLGLGGAAPLPGGPTI
jgi:uncharacterized RDD family membrane protein YckC